MVFLALAAAVLCQCFLAEAEPLTAEEGSAPAYYSWILGNKKDVKTRTKGYTMIQGGGTDMDQAMAWMLKASGGGDVVVIRDGKEEKVPPSWADAYNPYFYSQLNVTVDSVETIFLNSRSVAQNPDVVQTVRNAECLFFTGGDQNYYYNYIVDTPLQDAIRYLQTVKRAPVGGTSAGCAIQGQYLYTAEEGSATSGEALRDPYNRDLTFARNFLATPYLQNVTTDTHYSQRDRHGRQMAFLARVSTDYDVSLPAGIGLDETTALAIDDKGYARVFGYGTAYFLIQNRRGGYPETCRRGDPLDWYRSRQAVQTYVMAGDKAGSTKFDLVLWRPVSSSTPSQYWFVDDGYFGTDPGPSLPDAPLKIQRMRA